MSDLHPTPEPPVPAPPTTDQVVAPASAPVIEERMHPLSPLVSLWLGVVALGWFAVTSFLQGDPIWEDFDRLGEWLTSVPWWVFIAAGGVLIGLGFGYWGWWTTKFVIDDREFRLENTGAFQESQRIAFSRIQSVDVTQPFAARLLGLAEVKIDVGAEGGASLKYLRRARATEVRDYLMTRAHGRAASTAEPGRTASAWDDAAEGDEVLVRLTPGEIILSAFANAEIAWIGLGFLIPWTLGQLFGWDVLAWGGGMAALGIALITYLSRRLFGQFNYTLARTPAGLRITRGLFTLRSQTIPTHRVQAVAIDQPLVWRWLGRARLQVTILGLGELDGGDEMSTSTVYLPFGTAAQTQVALSALWPGLALDRLQFFGSPPRARKLDWFSWRWQGFAHDDRVIVGRTGWTHRRQFIIPHARLQCVQVSQGPWERRLGLANVALHTTDLLGNQTVPHLDEADARRLAFNELDQARTSRASELLDRPGLRDATVVPDPDGVVLTAQPGRPIDIWTPSTAPLPDRLPEPLPAGSEPLAGPGAERPRPE